MNRLFREQEVLKGKRMFRRGRFDPNGDSFFFSFEVKLPNGHVYPMYADLYDYPHSFPRLFVRRMLKDCNGKELSGCDGQMHVLSAQNGCTQLCYAHSSAWSPNLGLKYLVKRSYLWLIAYEAHLQTGKPIAYYLSN